MAVETLTDVSVSLGGTDVSSYVTEVAIDNGSESLDRTVFGNAARKFGSGIADWTITMTAFQDYGASAFHSIAGALLGSDVAIIIKKDSTASTSATNPQWTATGHMTRYTPIGAKVGEDPIVEIEFKSAGTVVAEATS